MSILNSNGNVVDAGASAGVVDVGHAAVGGATIAALRYVRHAPVPRGVMLRAGLVMFCASALFALLPTLAHTLAAGAIGYGVLLGSFGAGAIAGAVLMQRATARWSRETVVSTACSAALR